MGRPSLRRIVWIAFAALMAASACVPADLSSVAPKPSSDASFVTKRFVPTIALVPGSGWRAILDVPDAFTLDDGDPPDLSFLRVSAVFDPVSQRVTKLPKDLEAWILANPLLDVRSPMPVTVGGIEGIQIDAKVVKAPKTPYAMRGRLCPIPGCVGLFVAGTIIDGRIGSVFRFILIDVGGQPLMIEADAMASDWGRFLRRADAVLQTVRFTPVKGG